MTQPKPPIIVPPAENLIKGDYTNLPWIISFPRVGSHWVSCALELYADARRLFFVYENTYRNDPISLLPSDKPFGDYAWVHSHFTTKPLPKVAYIIRDPVDTLFSFGMAKAMLNTDVQTVTYLSRHFDLLSNSLKKWVFGPEKASVVVRYEDLQSSPGVEFKKVTDFMGLPWDEEKALKALSDTTKGMLAKNAKKMNSFFHVGLESPEYAERRSKFRERFGTFIYENVLKDGIENIFTPQG